MELKIFPFLLLFSTFFTLISSQDDTAFLLKFRLETDTHGNLLSNWTTTTTPCTNSWLGVKCTKLGRVYHLQLPSLNLRGPISTLSSLDQLRFLDLSNNRLNGSLLPLTKCANLKHVYLSNNDFSEDFPKEFGSLSRVLRIDVADNNLRGSIPVELLNLTRLLILKMENNEISGKIPDFSESLSELKEMNLSNNELFGRLPNGLLRKFGVDSFLGNQGLCGSTPLPTCSFSGNRGPGRIPLDWTTRISLVLGAARGLARIHEEYTSTKIPHGNVKSTNVLLDKNGAACIADFGLSLLLKPVHAIARLGGYKSPEQSETKRLSQQADVYSFGVLLLEVLTAKPPTRFPSPSRPKNEEEELSSDLPKWVKSVVREEWTAEVFDPELLRYKNIEEELVAMLHVAMACVAEQPEKRPTMMEVAKMIEEIRVEQSPLCDDYDESRNSLSPSVPTTEDAVVGF